MAAPAEELVFAPLGGVGEIGMNPDCGIGKPLLDELDDLRCPRGVDLEHQRSRRRKQRRDVGQQLSVGVETVVAAVERKPRFVVADVFHERLELGG